MTTFRLEVEPLYVEQIIAYLKTVPIDNWGKFTIESEQDSDNYIESWNKYK